MGGARNCGSRYFPLRNGQIRKAPYKLSGGNLETTTELFNFVPQREHSYTAKPLYQHFYLFKN